MGSLLLLFIIFVIEPDATYHNKQEKASVTSVLSAPRI